MGIYEDLKFKKVVAYFTRERNIFRVHGFLREANSEQMTFENASVDILTPNGEEISEEGYTGKELEDGENEFLSVRFGLEESDLVAICKTRENK